MDNLSPTDLPPADASSLDPADWSEFLAVAHRAVDDAVARIAALRDGPVWTPMPEPLRQGFRQALPMTPQPLAEIYAQVMRDVIPHAMGNQHPRFWSWYMGAGDLTGALADFLAAVDGSNLGGGDTAAAAVDMQVTDWIRQMVGFPEAASAALVSGGSAANLIGLTAARNAMAGADLREQGLAAMPQPLAFYASDQVHNCHDKAMNVLGLGHRALRRVPTDAAFRMELAALRRMVADDRAAGVKPACVIATAGSTNTGSVDDLAAIAAFCKAEGIWLHVDGCIGALLAIAPQGAALVRGMEQADSLAMDLHKWMHAPFDAGCVVIRDRTLHFSTFSEEAEYLARSQRGLAAGEFLHNYTLETTRSFRALKLWMMLRHHGVARFGQLIDRNLAQARALAAKVGADPKLTLMAPAATSVVCFRYEPETGDADAVDALNRELLLRLQEAGIAAPSGTTLRGRYALRVAFCNHRTRIEDIDLLLDALHRIGAQLESGPPLARTA
ncbi:pyridoxal phosphate-dependent decarboxylase family protein [Paragemmobacter straminiformis]|uniref:Aminotransferase class V-fold PLP-dependent enzyme n=1 Tax=Paragemmobacter straminiformis TaxID=2045119 RepID=A0A842I4E3_9RHOB|nr:aminotransferase class V-fold PLP-dependent enzyme [Gemmobacter straminiformis]MBC2834014.1 aminotransferase class V-fold PLP-dependent enzyme [Gemmobacter straminiformis]